MESRMIKLFVSDSDGCLSEPYCSYALEHFSRLAAYVRAAGGRGAFELLPAFTLCSGRAYPYVEAMVQVLGVQMPVLFESGGGMFDPLAARVIWNPAFTEEAGKQIEEVRDWLKEQVAGTSMMYDYGKRTQAGIIGPDRDEVARFVPIVKEYIEARFPELGIFYTPVSIDIALPGITKKEGVHWLARVCNISVEEMAFIGDTNGDIGALEEVGYSFAPANAMPSVKEVVSVVTQAGIIEGVLEAYQWCMSSNEEILSEVE